MVRRAAFLFALISALKHTGAERWGGAQRTTPSLSPTLNLAPTPAPVLRRQFSAGTICGYVSGSTSAQIPIPHILPLTRSSITPPLRRQNLFNLLPYPQSQNPRLLRFGRLMPDCNRLHQLVRTLRAMPERVRYE